MQWEPKCQHGSNFSVAFWHVLMFFPRTVLCNFSQALRRKLKTCRSFQVQSRRLYCWGAQAPFLTQLDVSLWWGNSLKTFLVKSKRLKSSLVLNRSFLLSSLQRTPGPCRILPYIFEACFTMKSKNKFQNKWKPELSYSNQVSDASFNSLKLVTWNTSFFFFHIDDLSEESGRTDGVCCQFFGINVASVLKVLQGWFIHTLQQSCLLLAAFFLVPRYLERHLIRLREIDMKHMFLWKVFFSLNLFSNHRPFPGS